MWVQLAIMRRILKRQMLFHNSKMVIGVQLVADNYWKRTTL